MVDVLTVSGKENQQLEGNSNYRWFISSLCWKDQTVSKSCCQAHTCIRQIIPQHMTWCHCDALLLTCDAEGLPRKSACCDIIFIVCQNGAAAIDLHREQKRCKMYEFCSGRRLPHKTLQFLNWSHRYIGKLDKLSWTFKSDHGVCDRFWLVILHGGSWCVFYFLSFHQVLCRGNEDHSQVEWTWRLKGFKLLFFPFQVC